jgi:hypothetical protein
MNSSDFNEEQRRTEPRKRSGWAKALIRPRTLKVLIAVGQLTAVALRLVFEAIHSLRE